MSESKIERSGVSWAADEATVSEFRRAANFQIEKLVEHRRELPTMREHVAKFLKDSSQPKLDEFIASYLAPLNSDNFDETHLVEFLTGVRRVYADFSNDAEWEHGLYKALAK